MHPFKFKVYQNSSGSNSCPSKAFFFFQIAFFFHFSLFFLIGLFFVSILELKILLRFRFMMPQIFIWFINKSF